MLKAYKLLNGNIPDWNDFFLHSTYCSYISSIPYVYTKMLVGKSIETFLFESNENIISGAHYAIKSSKANIIKTADILAGYIFKSEPNQELLSNLLDHFNEWSKSKNASYLRYFPWLPKSISNNTLKYYDWFDDLMKSKGFKPIKPGKYTYWIDLTKSEEDLLKQMKRQTRYEIKRAQDSPIVIERFDKPTNELFSTFWNLYHNLGQEKSFRTLEPKQLRQEFYSLMNAGYANLFIAYCNNIAVNVSFASNLGRASYLYGAINPNFKSIAHCPSPGQIAQWEMIKYMKSRGNKIYDMGFCPGAVPVKDHSAYSIWRFKYGFGGVPVEFLPVYGKVLQPLRGRLFFFLNKNI